MYNVIVGKALRSSCKNLFSVGRSHAVVTSDAADNGSHSYCLLVH